MYKRNFAPSERCSSLHLVRFVLGKRVKGIVGFPAIEDRLPPFLLHLRPWGMCPTRLSLRSMSIPLLIKEKCTISDSAIRKRDEKHKARNHKKRNKTSATLKHFYIKLTAIKR